MLFCERVSVSRGTDINKKGGDISEEWNVCFYYFFVDKNFTYQAYLCSGCHGTSVGTKNIKEDIFIIYSKNNCYRVVSNNLTRSQCQELIIESNLSNTIGYLQLQFLYFMQCWSNFVRTLRRFKL